MIDPAQGGGTVRWVLLAALVVSSVALGACSSSTPSANQVTATTAVAVTTVPTTAATTTPTTAAIVTPTTAASETGTTAPDQSTAASAPPGIAGTVPNLTGENLSQAEGTLLAENLGYQTFCGCTFGVIVASDWTVCSQTPAPGAVAASVNLVVSRECS
jgi:hypothetical protein